MKTIITIQHTQSVHHLNGMVGSWTDWPLTELGMEQAERIGENLRAGFPDTAFVLYTS
ncbi:MAG: histidine phosphatase family protein, partial [Clostridiales bacterium]|nr:histidine phosphatase family protein [Clostridiales bacterium]